MWLVPIISKLKVVCKVNRFHWHMKSVMHKRLRLLCFINCEKFLTKLKASSVRMQNSASTILLIVHFISKCHSGTTKFGQTFHSLSTDHLYELVSRYENRAYNCNLYSKSKPSFNLIIKKGYFTSQETGKLNGGS